MPVLCPMPKASTPSEKILAPMTFWTRYAMATLDDRLSISRMVMSIV